MTIKVNTLTEKIMERMICDMKTFPPWTDSSPFAPEMLLKSSEVAGLRLEVHSSTLGIKKGMDILQMLYDSEINFELSCFWDAGFIWKLGDDANGYVAEGNTRTVEEATTAL